MKLKRATEELDGLSVYWVDGTSEAAPLMVQVSLYRHSASREATEVAWTTLSVEEALRLRDYLNINLGKVAK